MRLLCVLVSQTLTLGSGFIASLASSVSFQLVNAPTSAQINWRREVSAFQQEHLFSTSRLTGLSVLGAFVRFSPV